MQITLRPVSADDEGLLFQVYASTREEELQLVNWTAEQKQSFLEMQFNAQRLSYAAQYAAARYDVILCDGQAAGRLIVDRADDEMLIVDIALLPEHRSRGIATALLKDLQAEAAAASKPLRLHVEFYNRALQLYTRLGFRKIGETGFHWFMEWRANDVASAAI